MQVTKGEKQSIVLSICKTYEFFNFKSYTFPNLVCPLLEKTQSKENEIKYGKGTGWDILKRNWETAKQ